MTVVTGRPGCGKSTYVDAHREPDDLVWDYDVILAALDGGLPRDDSGRHRGTMEALRRAFLANVQITGDGVWMIVTDPNYGHRIARDFGGAHVTEDGVREWRLAHPLEVTA